jgi:hypothetical protein
MSSWLSGLWKGRGFAKGGFVGGSGLEPGEIAAVLSPPGKRDEEPVRAMTMIERVARAIYVAELGPTGDFDDYFWDKHRATYLAQARAAIEAMREPTEAMIAAGGDEQVGSLEGDWNEDIGRYAAEKAYQAMVLRALSP